MIDHIVINARNLEVSKRFYQKALEPLGYDIIWDLKKWVGFGQAGKAEFWIALREPHHTKVHVAFRSKERGVVDQFYSAALQAGGKDNGPPGIREHYHPNYYGAFVFDPDGNNVEAVCHKRIDNAT